MTPFAKFLRKTGFRHQLTAVVTAGVLCIALLSSLASSWMGSRQIRDTLVVQGMGIAENLARQSKLALLFDSPENVADAVALTLAFPDMLQVEVLRADGRPLIVQTKSGLAAQPSAPPSGEASQRALLEAETDDAWRFVAPIYTEAKDSPFELEKRVPETLGHVRVVQSKATLARMMGGVFAANLAISFFFAFLFLIAIRVLTGRLTRPITQLSEAMAKAEHGEVGVRADPLAGPRDIGDMAHAFNSMMSVLEERERDLRRARDDAMQFARLKAEFAATVSHEIRTPLNGVVGTLDMLMASNLPARQRQFVEIAWDSAQYLLDLINNILDFSRLEAGKLKLEKSAFEVRHLIEEVTDLLAQQAHQKGLELGYVIAHDVPGRVRGDPRATRQILINLVGNAVKFTPSGEIALRVNLEEVPASHDERKAPRCRLRFEVSDTGIGIGAEARQGIFDSFTQVDTTTTRRYGGSGLGLAICKQLVGLMGGEIGVESEPNKGSRFWFILPVDIDAEPAALPADGRWSGRGLKVLVVEESGIVQHFLEHSLDHWGFICRTARGADEALTALREAAGRGAAFDTVIMDMAYASIGGGELLSRIRGEAALESTRVVLMNRFGDDSLSPGAHAEADAYITKPLRLERLLDCLVGSSEGRGRKPGAPATPVGARDPDRAAPRVLVVEDNRTNQAIAQGMLSMLGCEVEIAENGPAALRAFKRTTWDLILMDCNMPDMDGYEVTAAIRAMEVDAERRTPIVALTANAQPSDIEKCLSAGMDDHLPKPFTLGSVSARLNGWLAAQSVQPPDDNWVHAEIEHAQDKDISETLDPAVINKLREALGDSIGQAIRPFLEDMPAYFEEIELAHHAAEPERLRRVAHAVKGAAGNLGAVALAAVAKEIEERAEANALTGIEDLVSRLRAEYGLVQQALMAELKSDLVRPPLGAGDDTLVLVVDDDRSTRSALRFALQRGGFRVEEASDGSQALALVGRLNPDVILMDALMPVMDGFTACAKLQETPQGKNVPVLMITALEDNSSIERAFAAGASDYIAKPIHLTVVNQRVKRVVEAMRAERHVRHLAYNDTLTGLPNRALFTDYLSRFIERAESRGHSLAVLFLDLDRFKFVNDTLGHEIGDRLLRSVARRIKHCVRVSDCVARLGGDEFTVVLDDVPNAGSASSAAEKICHALSAPFEIDTHDIFVSASIGISLYPGDGTDVSTLLRHADTAMYRAKKNNSGYAFYEAGMEVTVSEHLRVESALRRALERNEFVVYFQPTAETESGRLTGAEALLRWNHPTRGLVAPGDFIPLAEETGLIIPIGEWVLHETCRQAKRWLGAGLPQLRFAVNISGKQLRQARFVEVVKGALADTKLDPRYLMLEFTESVIMEHARETVSILRQLKDLGVSLAVDDFGTGYSSLSYLKRFPVDVLKIDYTFTQEITSNPDDASILTGIIALAHSLRLKVVAEGVETQAQRDMLARQGCDFIQGYYLSEPAPVEEFQSRVLKERFSAGDFALRPPAK